MLLSKLLGVSSAKLRKIIAQFLLEESAEGTAAFHTSLREILIGSSSTPRVYGNRIHLRNREVRLIDEDGTQLGIMSTKQATEIARDRGLDLFLVHPDANPPVARIMDYGKYKFDLQKRARTTKRRHHQRNLKIVKMRYEIGSRDYQVKLRQCKDFLNAGDKIRVVIALHGREAAHADLAIALMNRFANELMDCAVIDSSPEHEGGTVTMLLGPHPPVRSN